MGLDIRLVIEYAENGVYHSFDLGWGALSRNYYLFGLLAFNFSSVDSEPRFPRFPPRGLPSDISLEVRKIFFVPNYYYFNLVKIEPEFVDEAQLMKLLEQLGESIINHYKETGYAPVWAYTRSVKLNKILSEKDIIRLKDGANGRNLNDFLDRSTTTIYDDEELESIFKRFEDWQSSQNKRTDVIRYEYVEKLQLFLESYGDWAIREYEATGLIPDCNSCKPSWLNFNELKEAAGYSVDSEFEEGEEAESEIEMVLTVMQGLAKKYGNENVRMVFWFG